MLSLPGEAALPGHSMRPRTPPTDLTPRRQRFVSTSAQGKVVDGQGGDIAGLTLVLDDVSGLLERELGRVEKTTSGSFTLNYPADNSELGRRLRLRIRSATTSSRRSRRTTSRLPSSASARSRSRAAWRRRACSPHWERARRRGSREGNDRVARRQHRRVAGRAAARARGHDGRGQRSLAWLQLDVGPFSATPSGEKPELVLKFDPESMTLPRTGPSAS